MGQSGAVSYGQSDLVAMRGRDVRVLDRKTDTPRNSDQLQVMLYLYALLLVDTSYKDKATQGEVAYRADAVVVSASTGDGALKQQLARRLQLITSQEPPERVPSYGECRFCDISRNDCPARLDTQHREAQVDFF